MKTDYEMGSDSMSDLTLWKQLEQWKEQYQWVDLTHELSTDTPIG